MKHAARNIRLPDCGLTAEWSGRVWLNPPYSNVHEWLDKMIEHGNGIALVNARPETMWFQRSLTTAHSVLWLKGRIDFLRPDGKETHPPVGSVLVAYGEHNALALEASPLNGVAMLFVAGRAAGAGVGPQLSAAEKQPNEKLID
jgi:hypothetical protein